MAKRLIRLCAGGDPVWDGKMAQARIRRLGVANPFVILYLCGVFDRGLREIAMIQAAVWRILHRRMMGLLWGGLSLMAAPAAFAQNDAPCADPVAHCIAQCQSASPDSACAVEGDAVTACRAALNKQCARLKQPASAPKTAAPRPAAAPKPGPEPAPPPPPGRQRTIGALSFPAPQDVKLYFLTRDTEEPADAALYGYVLVGADVTSERKAAVAQGLACRLDAATVGAPAAGLGLMVTPSKSVISASPVSPTEWLDAYDFPRADRWGRQVASALGLGEEMNRRILFLAAPTPLSTRLDGDAPLRNPELSNDGVLDFLVADASDLSPRYLRRWTHNLVEGVRAGALSSEQEMQEWMEFHSWLEMAGRPFAELIELRASTAEADEVFDCL